MILISTFSVYLQILSQDDSCRWIGCQNNGACVKINKEYTCECGVQWIGKLCETKNSEYNQRYLSLACVQALHFRIECELAKVLFHSLTARDLTLERLRVTFTANCKRQIQVVNFLKQKTCSQSKTIALDKTNVKLRILG